MKRKTGILAILTALLLFAAIPAACDKAKPELTLEVSVPESVSVGEEVTPQIDTLDEAEVVITVTAPDGTSQTVESSFTAAQKGTYSVAVKATRGEDVKEKTVKVSAYDLTAPTITAPPADKTTAKGVYDFTDDLGEVVAADDTTSAATLLKWIKSISYDGAPVDFDEKGTTYDFAQAGEYTVTFVVSDEDENKAEGTYKITVEGIKAALGKTSYEIGETIALPEAEIFPKDGEVICEYVFGEKTTAVEDDFALYEAGDYTLKLTLKKDGAVKDALSLPFKVTDIALEIDGDVKPIYAAGDKLNVPAYKVSNKAAEVKAVLTENGEPREVASNEEIALSGGSYVLEYTVKVADRYEKTYTYKFYCRYEGEMVSFEPNGGSYDGGESGVETVGTVTINEEKEFVKYGAQSAKIVVNSEARGGFTWFQNARKYTDVENANTLKFWVYVGNAVNDAGKPLTEARVKFTVETGVTQGVDYFKYTTGIIVLKAGQWNEVTVDLAASDCNLADGLCALYFQQWDPAGDWTWASKMHFYLDGIAAAYVEPVNSISVENSEITADAGNFSVPAANVKYGEAEIVLAKEGEEGRAVKAGEKVTLEEGAYYTLTYTAEKMAGNDDDDVLTATVRVYARAANEMVSFEPVGESYDGAAGVAAVGTFNLNTDAAYVKYGKQSAKLKVSSAATAGFTWYAGGRKYTSLENANALKFWVYVDNNNLQWTEARVKFTVETGEGSEGNYVKYTTDIVVMKAGQWNEIVIDLSAGDCDLADGLCALYFQQWDPAGDWTWNSDMIFYVDGICAAVSE